MAQCLTPSRNGGWGKKLEEWLSNNPVAVLFWVLGAAVLAIAVVVSTYVFTFRANGISSDPDYWGKFGDYLGGTLNPILAFLSVLALLATLVIQSRELRISTEELQNSTTAVKAQNHAIEQQRFEQTFFSWLESYKEQLQSIEIVVDNDTGVSRRGPRALYSWWGSNLSSVNVYSKLRKKGVIPPDATASNSARMRQWINAATDEQATEIRVAALELWEELYLNWEFYLDSLFRNLYRLLLWIDSQHRDQLSLAQKWLYVSIIRGQLSWSEQVFLYYNGLTKRGAKFKTLAEKYALFDNLNFESDPVLRKLHSAESTRGDYADSAFDSQIARTRIGLPQTAEETLALAAIREIRSS